MDLDYSEFVKLYGIEASEQIVDYFDILRNNTVSFIIDSKDNDLKNADLKNIVKAFQYIVTDKHNNNFVVENVNEPIFLFTEEIGKEIMNAIETILKKHRDKN